jgi:hypothetical protein
MLRRFVRFLDGGEHRVLGLFAVCVAGLIGSLVLLKRGERDFAYATAGPTVVAWLLLGIFCITRRQHPSEGRDSYDPAGTGR